MVLLVILFGPVDILMVVWVSDHQYIVLSVLTTVISDIGQVVA